jgi:hypothetical protein
MPINKIFYGYTYATELCDESTLIWWKKNNCKRGWHLWDEVRSEREHYLYCDACGVQLYIDDKAEEKSKCR